MTDTAGRSGRRLLVSLNIFVALCLVASTLGYGYYRWRLDQVHGVNLPSLTPLSGPKAQERAKGQPPQDLPQTILIVGSDSRAGQAAGDGQHFGDVSTTPGQRSDTIMLLRVDPQNNTATLLSIPRDLFVAIPGTAGKDRINSTFDRGPDLLVRTIHDDLNIEVNHYIALDFVSFRGIVNAVGNIKVYFPTPARDLYSGLNIAVPGCTTLNGDVALSYVRARHYQYYEDGRWKVEAESDLARIRRQQDFVRKLMTKALNSDLTDPARLDGVVSAVVNNLSVDSALKRDQSDLLRLIKRLKILGGDRLSTFTVPTVPMVVHGADVLDLKQPEASQTIARFLGVGLLSPAAPPSSAVAPSTTAAAPTTTAPPALPGGPPGAAAPPCS